MNVRVVGVSVNRGDGSRLREVLGEVFIDHLLRLLIIYLSIKRIDGAVVGALFAAPALWPLLLILFELARILSQVCRALLVVDALLGVVGVVGILRDILRPDSFLLAFGGVLSCHVAHVCACRACTPDADRHECAAAAHPLNSCPISSITC
jgi:hypothetical protein